MADGEALHRCVTQFMMDTCGHSTSEYAKDIHYVCFLGRVFRTGLLAAKYEDLFFGHCKMFISGSSAEFRIKPMLSCIGDVDIMAVSNNILAIQQGDTPPTELPDHYQRMVLVVEINDSHQPGYVYLQKSYMLVKTDNSRYVTKKIEYKKCPKIYLERFGMIYDNFLRVGLHDAQDILQRYMNQEIYGNSWIQSLLIPTVASSGPAMNGVVNSNVREIYKPQHRLLTSVDIVPSFRCLHWPPQASNWPTTYRDHGWPDATTINIVVSNGCDVVGAVHPRCRQDEWTNDNQWRLSFSRAEVTLLNSCTPVQQIIYHMLRFVMKREVFAKTKDKDQGAQKLSNYHIKTLMLWECEQKPQSWWSAESALVKLCSSLLRKLSGWVNEKRCHHYFLNNCNLLDHFLDNASSLTIRNCLKTLENETVLLSWFVENYIRKCAECCPTEISTLFQDICSFDKLENAVQAVAYWKRSILPKELYTEHHKSEAMIQGFMLVICSDATTQLIMKELRDFDMRLRDYFVALKSLRVAYTISIHTLTEELLDILWTLFDPCDDEAGDSAGLLSIKKAMKLGSLSNFGSNALETLYQEISKAYLHHFLERGNESTHCVVHVLLATLYYKSGQQQAAVDHCNEVLNQCFRDCHRSQSIGTEYLPQIDDNVDSVFGLVLLYQHVQANALHPGVYPQEVNKPAFTTELLAQYLYSQCLGLAVSNYSHLKGYRQHLSKSERLHLCDLLLFKEMEIQFDQCTEIAAGNTRTDDANLDSSSTDPSLLATTLELVALEKLITFRQVMVHELHSEQFPILNEFEPLYSYKCGMFEECLEICRNHVNLLLCASCSKTQLYGLSLPQCVCILEGELVSLFGVIRILHPALFLFLLQFPYFESISVLTLSLYLMVQCQKTLRKDTLVDSLQLIRFVHDKMYPADDNEYFVDRLILKLTYRSLKLYIGDESQHQCR